MSNSTFQIRSKSSQKFDLTRIDRNNTNRTI